MHLPPPAKLIMAAPTFQYNIPDCMFPVLPIVKTKTFKVDTQTFNLFVNDWTCFLCNKSCQNIVSMRPLGGDPSGDPFVDLLDSWWIFTWTAFVICHASRRSGVMVRNNRFPDPNSTDHIPIFKDLFPRTDPTYNALMCMDCQERVICGLDRYRRACSVVGCTFESCDLDCTMPGYYTFDLNDFNEGYREDSLLLFNNAEANLIIHENARHGYLYSQIAKTHKMCLGHKRARPVELTAPGIEQLAMVASTECNSQPLEDPDEDTQNPSLKKRYQTSQEY